MPCLLDPRSGFHGGDIRHTRDTRHKFHGGDTRDTRRGFHSGYTRDARPGFHYRGVTFLRATEEGGRDLCSYYVYDESQKTEGSDGGNEQAGEMS